MFYTRASCAAAIEELELDGLDGHALDGRRRNLTNPSLIAVRRFVEWERLEALLSLGLPPITSMGQCQLLLAVR